MPWARSLMPRSIFRLITKPAAGEPKQVKELPAQVDASAAMELMLLGSATEGG